MGRVKCGLLLKFIHVSGDKQGVRPFSIGDSIDWMGSKMGPPSREKQSSKHTGSCRLWNGGHDRLEYSG